MENLSRSVEPLPSSRETAIPRLFNRRGRSAEYAD